MFPGSEVGRSGKLTRVGDLGYLVALEAVPFNG